jgi:hypothetical protein
MLTTKVRVNIIYLFWPRPYEAIFDEEYRLSIRLLQVFEVPVQD